MGHYNIHFSPTGGTRKVAAIDALNPKTTDPKKCISCIRCIGICPKGARNVDQNLWNMMAQKMAPVLGGRKENHLFL
jgi:ferredoxin